MLDRDELAKEILLTFIANVDKWQEPDGGNPRMGILAYNAVLATDCLIKELEE